METSDYKIFVSPQAIEQIKRQLDKRGTPHSCLRLGVQGGGCSGYSYVLQFEDAAPKSRDLSFDIGGVCIFIDNKSILYLDGCTLDWEKTLMNQGFKFINPRAKSKCGCGVSFDLY